VVSSQKLYRTLGEAIRAERKKAGLSQEKLAEKADLNRNYIGEIERAEKKITVETLWKIAKVLNVRLRDLVSEL
jgi:transcriptional regulator with XRE-family HTH domain